MGGEISAKVKGPLSLPNLQTRLMSEFSMECSVPERKMGWCGASMMVVPMMLLPMPPELHPTYYSCTTIVCPVVVERDERVLHGVIGGVSVMRSPAYMYTPPFPRWWRERFERRQFSPSLMLTAMSPIMVISESRIEMQEFFKSTPWPRP